MFLSPAAISKANLETLAVIRHARLQVQTHRQLRMLAQTLTQGQAQDRTRSLRAVLDQSQTRVPVVHPVPANGNVGVVSLKGVVRVAKAYPVDKEGHLLRERTAEHPMLETRPSFTICNFTLGSL